MQNLSSSKIIIIAFLVVITLFSASCSKKKTNLNENEIMVSNNEIIINNLKKELTRINNSITITEEIEVIPEVLTVTRIHSVFAHGQHLVYIKGKYKQSAGELYLTFHDIEGNPLQIESFKPDEVQQINEEWISFQHRLTQSANGIQYIDKASVIFEIRNDEQIIREKLEIPLEYPPILVSKEIEVIPNTLIILNISSYFYNGQHLVDIGGKYRQEAGELYLTFQDMEGNPLEQSGLLIVDKIQKSAEEEWFYFMHTLVEDVDGIPYIDKATVIFEIRNNEHIVEGKLDIPLRLPPSE